MILPAIFPRATGRATCRDGPRRSVETAAGGEAPWSRPERFAADLVLRDLEPGRDAGAAERIIARFLVTRIALGDPAAVANDRGEREAAREYLGVLPEDAERRSLSRLLSSDRGRPLARAAAFRAAADAAAAQRHVGGAFLLYRQAFHLARAARDRRQAGGAARALARLSRSVGADRFARAWSARARRLERAHAAGRVIIDAMGQAYTREQRGEIERAARAGERIRCPACGEALVETPVPPRQDVAYVRRRLWLLCLACRRSASVDVSAGGPP